MTIQVSYDLVWEGGGGDNRGNWKSVQKGDLGPGPGPGSRTHRHNAIIISESRGLNWTGNALQEA